jgi:hypothetical protein
MSLASATALIRQLARDPGRIVFWEHALEEMDAAHIQIDEVYAMLCACEVRECRFEKNQWRDTAEGPADRRTLGAPVIIVRDEARLLVVTAWEVL